MGRGVLRPGLAADRFGLARIAPSGPLASFVDYYWIVRWNLRGQPAYEQTILPHPNVNLVFEASGAGIYGVGRSLFARLLSGQGKALGSGSGPGASGRSGGHPSRSSVTGWSRRPGCSGRWRRRPGR